MPTSKPRITITLSPHVYSVLRRLSAAGGESMSTLVTGFLDVAVPPMERMVVIMEQANSASEETKKEIRTSLLAAEARILPALASAIDQSDLFLNDVARHSGAPAGGGGADPGGRSGGVSTPVPVTRGLGRGKQTESMPTKGGRRALV